MGIYMMLCYCVDVMVQLLFEVDGIGGFASIDEEKTFLKTYLHVYK